MFLVVLLLVLAAGGVLVGSVLSGQPEWAWLSVLFSVLGAGLLVVERARQRRRGPASAETDTEPRQDPEVRSPAAPESVEAVAAEAGVEPGEEDTAPGDLLLVSELDAEVLVIDERPRYHLKGCGWVGSSPVFPLPVREARELGFTACARCVPDATLARNARAAR